jgi:A/G-specific adenine glycosylase
MKSLVKQHAIEFSSSVLQWYAQYKRVLPWRQTTNPYYIYVSEVMLQQTQVSRVIPKYLTFIQTFPTPQHLARAPLSEVLQLWSGLGYNRRAKFLHDAIRTICQTNNALIPQTYDELIAIHGIGPYTANAILAFAYNKPVIVIDANVKKVLYQVFGLVTQQQYEQALTLCLPHENPRDFYNALMDIANSYYTKSCDWSTYPFKSFCMTYTKKPLPERKTYKQKPFTGSNRYFRGQLLKQLLDKPVLKKSLSQQSIVAAKQLLAEGLIEESRTQYYISNTPQNDKKNTQTSINNS